VSLNVLVARMDSAGDVLLAGPAIRAVARRAGRLTLACGPRGAAAGRLLPGVDGMLVQRAEWIDPEPPPVERRRTLAFVDALASGSFDQALILTSFHQSPLPLALLLRLAAVAEVAAISPDYPGSLLDLRHLVDDDLHEVERSLSLAAALGYELPPGDDGGLAVKRHPGSGVGLRGPYVAVHPGTAAPARAWPVERHVELVRRLSAAGRSVVVTGGPDEARLTGEVSGPAGARVHDLGGRLSLAQLAEVLAGADVLVAGNTGPAHLAAAVGTPVVSLYAPTVPAVRWRPWGVPHVLLYSEVPCAGCRARDCPVASHPCLAGVAVEDVLEAVEQLAVGRDAVVA
jgi:ADP-heptose:LPS heptosyltransferase